MKTKRRKLGALVSVFLVAVIWLLFGTPIFLENILPPRWRFDAWPTWLQVFYGLAVLAYVSVDLVITFRQFYSDTPQRPHEPSLGPSSLQEPRKGP